MKVIAIVLVAYAGLVTAFESLLGAFQPAGGGTMVIVTMDPDGSEHPRVVSRLESGDELFVAANHWPRAWYRRALANPSVRIEAEGIDGAYAAVPATDDERARIDAEHGLGLTFRFLTGFPPRRILRLDPR